MLLKLVQSFQSFVTKYPATLTYVDKSVNWLKRQPFTPDLSTFWTNLSFTINLGNFPEVNVTNFVLTKTSGSKAVYRPGNKVMTIQGLIDATKRKVAAKKSAAAELSQVARVKATEAQRLAAEAARLASEAAKQAEVAEAEANSFASAFSKFATVR